MPRVAVLLALVPLLAALALRPTAPAPGPETVQDRGPDRGQDAFAATWYQGKAELSRYELHIDRYGEERVGDAVLVFVTEDFLPGRQVKYEGADPAGAGAVKVLKLNHIERFTTGVYDYSLMRSVFTPVNGSPTLKITASVQDWCGHVWQQINRAGEEWRYRLFSYFQREGDVDSRLPGVLSEDEVWVRIRLDPGSLPTGKIRMIPGAFDARLRHREPTAREAEATLEEDGALRRWSVRYPDLDRSLTIGFEAAAPYRIVGWTERWKERGKPQSARAELSHRRMAPYWSEHGNDDAPLRAELGLR